jgi:Protein of unknwon function (DUF3310)
MSLRCLACTKNDHQACAGMFKLNQMCGCDCEWAEKAASRIARERQVDHPSHYGGDTTYEAIKVIEAWRLDFHLGNALKYICRAGKKRTADADTITDLKKAAWYIEREIAFSANAEQPKPSTTAEKNADT